MSALLPNLLSEQPSDSFISRPGVSEAGPHQMILQAGRSPPLLECLVKVLEIFHVAALQICSTEAEAFSAQDVETALVEWPLGSSTAS